MNITREDVIIAVKRKAEEKEIFNMYRCKDCPCYEGPIEPYDDFGCGENNPNHPKYKLVGNCRKERQVFGGALQKFYVNPYLDWCSYVVEYKAIINRPFISEGPMVY